MKTRIESAAEKRTRGYNCAQAVACNYCDLVGIDEETMFKITEAFGAGMGNMEGTCGAISGACVIAGMMNSTGNLESPDSKASTGKLARMIMTEFKNKNKSVTCKELKGVESGKILCSCDDCVKDASELVEKILFSDK